MGDKEKWFEELENHDSTENNLMAIEELEVIYLESKAADDRLSRIRIAWLIRHVKKLF